MTAPPELSMHVTAKFAVRKDSSVVYAIATDMDGIAVPFGTVTNNEGADGIEILVREHRNVDGFLIDDDAARQAMDQAVADYDEIATTVAFVPMVIAVQELIT